MPYFIRTKWNPQYFIHEVYDWIASKKVRRGDIFVGWSSFSLHSLKRAREKGAIIIIERGSSHISYQNDILMEEYGKFGLKAELPHPKIIEKELKEYEEADYIVIPSIFAKRTFIEKGIPEKKIIYVPYGVDLKFFKKIEKNDDIFRVVFVGAMTLRKGIHYLLQAFSELNLPNSELVLIGAMADEMRPFFKKYEGKFKWTGIIRNEELYQYYSQSSVFVLNSIEDGFGMVIIEAMACGLPVICTENTGGPDIVRDGKDGFIIPIRNVEKLKEKLLYLYKEKDILKKMSQSAKERTEKLFTWDDYGDKIINAYKKVLDENFKK